MVRARGRRRDSALLEGWQGDERALLGATTRRCVGCRGRGGRGVCLAFVSSGNAPTSVSSLRGASSGG